MVICPVCGEMQLAYVKAPKRTACYYCGARWTQHEDEQVRVVPRRASSDPRSGKLAPTMEASG